MIHEAQLDDLTPVQLRELTARLLSEVRHKQATIDKLTHENAVLKRMKFAATSEAFQGDQRSLLEDSVDEDLEAVQRELLQFATKPNGSERLTPKRQALPAELPRREFHHEPDSTLCACGCQMKRIGEDVAEKLDYEPGVFTVERHIRGKWACAKCERLVQAPVEAHVIDKGIPTAGLLAQVLVAKYADHQPLYRQEGIYARSGVQMPRSTLAAWVGARWLAAPMRRLAQGAAVGARHQHGDAEQQRQDEGQLQVPGLGRVAGGHAGARGAAGGRHGAVASRASRRGPRRSRHADRLAGHDRGRRRPSTLFDPAAALGRPPTGFRAPLNRPQRRQPCRSPDKQSCFASTPTRAR